MIKDIEQDNSDHDSDSLCYLNRHIKTQLNGTDFDPAIMSLLNVSLISVVHCVTCR